MKVVHYLPFDDIGGVGYRSASALNRHYPDWSAQAWAGAPSYLQFPQHSTWDWDVIEEAVAEADVFHSHDHRAKVGRRWADVITFHGTGFRQNPKGAIRHADGARVLVSTLDLWLQAPDHVTWMPQMDDLDWLASFRDPQPRLTIGHFPTNPELKNTHEFRLACVALQDAGYVFDVEIGQGLSWRETLKAKGRCDIVFDQTLYGYGGNAIEAWAMGIPVISGGSDDLLAEFRRRFGYIPFVIAEPNTIVAALEMLMDDRARQDVGALGRRHAEHFHSYEAGADLLASIYREL